MVPLGRGPGRAPVPSVGLGRLLAVRGRGGLLSLRPVRGRGPDFCPLGGLLLRPPGLSVH